ncbi:hypothetical protein [Roseiconus lacunae]|uniref:Uncharacterized protein n=1 Tax=Roseiconus lacunae TaxID=2605694 RepID=A0ABT7PKZ2_9BACT|nr:hypothetical protein [Roseiconus lacunae]MDM4016961.1 hypothetical protein [Roseiconus lacunae]
MNQASSSTSHRRLGLEQLEKRSLLAGGLSNVIPTGFETGQSVEGPAADRLPRPAEEKVRTASRTGQTTPNVDLVSQVQPNALPESTTIPVSNTGTRAPVVDAVFSSLEHSEQRDATAGTDQVADLVSDNLSTKQSNTPLPQVSCTVVPDGVSHTQVLTEVDHSETDAAIRLSPFLGQPLTLSADLASRSWQFDRDLLPRLNEVAETPSKDVARYHDLALPNWWVGSGGMIAIDHFAMPETNSVPDETLVDVQLEGAVMLSRSVDLFTLSATSPIAVPVSQQAIDTVMTTLAKLTESKVQPLYRSTQIRLSNLVYPTLGLIVTGVALSARQRSKNAEFQKQVTSRRQTRRLDRSNRLNRVVT